MVNLNCHCTVHTEKPPVGLELRMIMTWHLSGRCRPRCGSGRGLPSGSETRLSAFYSHSSPVSCRLGGLTGSQIGNGDNKIFGRFRVLQPKIYGDTVVMVVWIVFQNLVGTVTLPFVRGPVRHENLEISHRLISFIFLVSI